jgi:hypothetical protein
VNTTRPKANPSLERVAFTVPEICFRNGISRQKYNSLRSEGRGPAEMRFGINTVRVTAEAERDWQLLMQEPQPEIELRAVERAVKAGDAAVKSEKHVSKRGRSAHASASTRQKVPQ